MNTQKTARSLKQKMAIATVAASLGVSLGFPVGEVLAADTATPSEASRQIKDRASADLQKGSSNQGKFKGNSGQHKDAAANQGKNESKQFKESNQGKLSNQYKESVKQ